MPAKIHLREKAGIGYFTVPCLEKAGIFHAFVTRHKGSSKGHYSSLNLGLRTDDDIQAVRKNDADLRKAFGISRIIRARQVHGNNVIVIDKNIHDEKKFLAEKADALITDQPGAALAVLTADCFPVILADPSGPYAAMIHAGRRGICMGVIERAVQTMTKNFGSNPRDMIAGVGPGIGPCCYKVDDDIAGDFRKAFPEEAGKILEPSADGLFNLDLFQAIQISLTSAGVKSIERLNLCTSCRKDLFFSHRRDSGITGRQINLVMIP